MMVIDKNTHAQITMHRVAARMEGITLNNLPFDAVYDHKTGIEGGDLFSYQMDHLPIEAQIILAEHQLNKVRTAISSWRRKNSKDGVNMYVGINDRERFNIFKNAPKYLGSHMNSALKPLAEIDPTILAEWKRLRDKYETNVHQIEAAYPKKTGYYKKRLSAVTPGLIKYLDAVDDFVVNLRGYYK
jgi:hypothetical protein